MSKPVLVIGGAGYVGSHTCKALARAGYLPITLDNLSTGHSSFVRWGPLIRCEMTDAAALAKIFDDYHIDTVLHFAACALVAESVADPQKYYNNNVVGTLAVLKAMRLSECKRLVFSSTCTIYGEPAKIPIDENTVPNPVNPYGASKMMVERILADYARAYGLKFIALRYFNACGADPDGEMGELRDPETHLIPRAMMAIQGHIDDFQVFGNDYPTKDGTAVRDYIHVGDLADAHVAAATLLDKGHAGGTFNLGTGRGYSVREVLEEICSITGSNLPTPYGTRRAGDPAILIANPSRARAELAFAPKMSDLSTIIRTAWDWHSKAHPRRRPETGNSVPGPAAGASS